MFGAKLRHVQAQIAQQSAMLEKMASEKQMYLARLRNIEEAIAKL
jgi:hypothetical protein